ncbi:MAG TPA: hypothetical protein VNK82_14430 [Terriglobales bacterium]|nr:hypothetical protein [Terriglobales bacterium]
MHRLVWALMAYAALALAAWQTLEDLRFRAVTLAVLGGLALRTLAHARSLGARPEPGAAASAPASSRPM